MSDSLMTPKWVYDAVEASWGRPALDPCWHPYSPVRPRVAWCLPHNRPGLAPHGVEVHAEDGLRSGVIKMDDNDPEEVGVYSELWDICLTAAQGDWIWLNPPYSLVAPWLEKAWRVGAPFAALLKFDPTTRWYENNVRSRDCDVGVFRERLVYPRTDGGKQMSANFVSCLVTHGLYRPPGLADYLDYLEKP